MARLGTSLAIGIAALCAAFAPSAEAGPARPPLCLQIAPDVAGRVDDLRACAVDALEDGNAATALRLLDEAAALAADLRRDASFARSFGVSLDLLRAVSLAELGRGSEAARIARQAATMRPYALDVQRAATILRSESRPGIEPAANLWGDLVRLDPGSRTLVEMAEMRAGNWAGVVALDDGSTPVFPAPPTISQLLGHGGGPTLAEWSAAYSGTMHQAYAHAALGHVEYAGELVAAAKAGLAEARTASAEAPAALAFLAMIETSTVIPLAAHVEARMAIEAGDVRKPRRIAASLTFAGPTGRDLARTFAARGDALLQPAALPASDLGLTEAPPAFAALARGLLLPRDRAVPDVAQASCSHSAARFAEIACSAAASPAMVQELALLAAARTAQAANRTYVLLTGRSDYAIGSRSPTGTGASDYRTVLRFAYLDLGDEEPAALDAREIIAALGPVYPAAFED